MWVCYNENVLIVIVSCQHNTSEIDVRKATSTDNVLHQSACRQVSMTFS